MGNRPGNQPLDRRETPLTPERCAVFLENLAETGIVVSAARAASPLSQHIDGSASTFYALKRRDPHFAAQWEAALEAADGALLAEAHRRAISGVDRRQYFKGIRIVDVDPATGKETPVSEKEYSDRLLELLLKARMPRLFVERKMIEHHNAPTGWTITASDLAALSEAQTEQLQLIMATIMTARGEIVADPMMVDITPDPETEMLTHAQLEKVIPY